ncbi:MAG: hypothetical protein KTR28_01185 [Micavibrio sp.]|nr:hypothetical protein [Micavibrio sp.]
METQALTLKDKLKFSLKVYLLLCVWGLMINIYLLPSPTSGIPAALFGYLVEYLTILAGPLSGAMEYNRIPFFIPLIPVTILCVVVFYALLKWSKTKLYMLVFPILTWTAMSTWTTFWFIMFKLYS